MVMLKLNLVKGEAADDAAAASNGTSPADYDNYGTPVLK